MLALADNIDEKGVRIRKNEFKNEFLTYL